jgi:hypothetical protein
MFSYLIYLYFLILSYLYLILSYLIDKIRLLGFTTLHDTRRYAIPQCWLSYLSILSYRKFSVSQLSPLYMKIDAVLQVFACEVRSL